MPPFGRVQSITFFTPIYCGVNSEAPVLIYLYLRDNHYHLITSMKGFLKKEYFCDKCLKPFHSFDRHECNCVARVGPCSAGGLRVVGRDMSVTCAIAYLRTRAATNCILTRRLTDRMLRIPFASGCIGARRAIRSTRRRRVRTSAIRESVQIVSAPCPGNTSVTCKC